MNRVQNEVSKVSHEERQQRLLHEAQKRNHQIEHDGCHKWVRLSKGGNNLRLLCRTDEKGNLLPKEQERIRKVKQALGIK